MSLATNITDLATRLATECKALRVLITGSGGSTGLTGLNTTAKSSIIAAINELDTAIDNIAGGGSATSLDALTDVTITTPTTGHILRNNGSGQFVNVLGTTHFEVAGAAAAAQSAAIAASQPLSSELTSLAAVTTTAYGRSLLALATAATLTAQIEAATETAAGKVELATNAETVTGTDTSRATTPAGVAAAIAALVASAPAALNTLNELAAAIGNDANFATTVTNQIAGKQNSDATLTALAALTTAADQFIYATAADTFAVATVTSVARSLLDDTTTTAMRATLGLVIGTDVQAYNANLGALAGLTGVADRLPYFTGAGAMTLATFTAAGRALVDDADAAAQRTTLGLVIGTNVQAQSANLAAVAGLTSAADRLPYFTGSGTAALATFTAQARLLLDDATAADMRTTIDVYSKAEVGDPTTNFVTTFEAGLV